MSNQIQLQLSTPGKLYCDKPYVMITVPGGEGDYGVKQGHAPMATTVGAGLVEAYTDDKTIADRWFVVGGYCEVLAHRCTVMANEVYRLEELDRTQLECEIAALKAAAKTSDGSPQQLKVAEAKLRALRA